MKLKKMTVFLLQEMDILTAILTKDFKSELFRHLNDCDLVILKSLSRDIRKTSGFPMSLDNLFALVAQYGYLDLLKWGHEILKI